MDCQLETLIETVAAVYAAVTTIGLGWLER